jgi:hypothetical protein
LAFSRSFTEKLEKDFASLKMLEFFRARVAAPFAAIAQSPLDYYAGIISAGMITRRRTFARPLFVTMS